MNKECLICLELKSLTREHRIKRSLLEYFNRVQNNSGVLFYRGKDATPRPFSNLKTARTLTPKKNICSECNASRSNKCDEHFDKLVKDAYNYQFKIPEVSSINFPNEEDIRSEAIKQKNNIKNDIDKDDFTDAYLIACSAYYLADKYQIFIKDSSYDEGLLKKYLAKHAICYLGRFDISAPKELRNIFLEGLDLNFLKYSIYFLPQKFDFGYLNTILWEPDGMYKYALIFSNLAIEIQFPKK